jgi:hypothetical protein
MKQFILLLIVLSIHFVNSQYTDYQSPFTGKLTSGDFATMPYGGFYSNQAWICGDSGKVMKLYPSSVPPVFRYVNTGLPSNLMLKSLGAVDTNTALTAGIIGNTVYLYRTTNSGLNWVQVFTQVNGSINGIWFKSATVGFMAGNPVAGRWSLWRTTNAGLNWDSTGMRLLQSGNETGFANSIFAKGDSIWMGTNNSRIYFSGNHGSTWVTRLINGVQNISTICYDFFNLGYAGGDSLINSYDFGNTWNIVHNIPGVGTVNGIVGSNPGVDNLSGGPVFYCKQNVLYYNLSFNWVPFHTATSGNYTYLFKARPIDSYGNVFSAMLGLMSNGKVWICNCAWGSVEPIGNNIPDEFTLYQNFPNPFNPVTNIRFDLPARYSSEKLELNVYDAGGRLVKQLLNGIYSPGTYEIEFNGSEFATGIYFYELRSGSIFQVKKMVIIK